MVMKRGQSVQMFLTQPQAPENDEERFWSNLVNRISNGQVIPILSNGLIYDLVFSKALGDGSAPDSASTPGAGAAPQAGGENAADPSYEPLIKMSVSNILSMAWASEAVYPFTEGHDLPHVAQYVRSKSRSPMDAKEAFVTFLKNALLSYASQVGVTADRISELRDGISEYSFADLAVKELGLLKFDPNGTDPLSILAGLPLPIYITTCYHDVLERALIACGKDPITQVCFWSGPVPQLLEKHKTLETFTPSPTRPLVYHLYGLDTYPLTMVLSEDDFMDLLVEITVDRGTTRSIIPAYLQSALAVSWQMLLGYRLPDWDFRTLFRGLISSGDRKNAAFLNTIIQLSLSDQYDLPGRPDALQFLGQAQKYLQDYFNPMSFEIRWSSPTDFLTSLQKEWSDRKQR
jgi:hypothetical protein